MASITNIDISKIKMSPWDRSKSYDQNVITKIVRDIQIHGCIDHNRPIVVNKNSDGNFTIIDGGAKYIAANNANLTTIPAVVLKIDNKSAALKFLDINNQNKLNNLTIGKIGLLIKSYDDTLKIGTIASLLSRVTGKDKSNIAKFIKGAEVYNYIENFTTDEEQVKLYNRSAYLHKISSVDKSTWITLGKYVAQSNKCQHFKKAINLINSVENLENGKFWCNAFFPLNTMVKMSLKNQTGIIAIKESFKKLNDALDYFKQTNQQDKIETLKLWLNTNAFKKRNDNIIAFKFRDVIRHAYKLLNPDKVSNQALIYGDCLEKMDSLKNETFDAYITDPPYGIHMRTIGSNKLSVVNDGRFDATNLIHSVANKLYQKMKNDTYTVVFCSDKMFDVFRSAFVNAGYKYVCTGIWHKNNHSQNDLLTSPLIITEFMLFFRKGRPTLFEPRNNVFKYDIPQDRTHPTQKPIDLIESLLECISIENSIIIDPFCGSGSTAKACQNLNRNFWTCEVLKSHYESAYNRLFNEEQNAVA